MIVVQNNDLNLSNDKLNILYFSATWCGPCKVLKPVMEEISKELSDSVNIFYIDINENTGLPNTYSIMSIPTLVFVKNGDIKNKIVGLQPKTNIIHAINNIE